MNYRTEQMRKAIKLFKKSDYALWLDGGPKKDGVPSCLKVVYYVPGGTGTQLCIYLTVAVRNKTERLVGWHCELMGFAGDHYFCISRLDRPDLDLKALMQWARMAAAMHAST